MHGQTQIKFTTNSFT